MSEKSVEANKKKLLPKNFDTSHSFLTPIGILTAKT